MGYVDFDFSSSRPIQSTRASLDEEEDGDNEKEGEEEEEIVPDCSASVKSLCAIRTCCMRKILQKLPSFC